MLQSTFSSLFGQNNELIDEDVTQKANNGTFMIVREHCQNCAQPRFQGLSSSPLLSRSRGREEERP